MSSTRRANKRARIQRRAENDAMRTARRDSLAVLLARLARGIAPTPDEAALLRATVEAEIRESDAARTSERGQQRAMEQQRQRVDAAEAAIVEAEQRAEDAERQLADMTRDRDGWWAAADRATEEHGRDAEEHRRRLAAVLAKHADTPFPDLIEYTAQCLTGAGERITAAEERAAQAATDVENLTTAHAEQQKMHDARRRDLADALGRSTGTAWPELIEHAAAEQRAARQWEEQAQLHARAAEQADAVTAETKQLMQRRTTTLRDRAQRAERRNADVRHYIENVYPGDIAEGVRVDLRRLLNGLPPTYGPSGQPEVITDRAAIRAALDENDQEQPR